MSSLYRFIRTLRFLYRPFSSSAPSPPPPLSITVNDLFQERNLKKLVENFKTLSEKYRFRCKHRIYDRTVDRLAKAKHFDSIKTILDHQKQFVSSEGFAVRLIALYGKSGMVDHARKLFDEMPGLNCVRTIKSFNALLSSAVDSKKFNYVGELFRELPSKLSLTPDVFTYNIVIKAECEMGNLGNALLMFDEMVDNGVNPNLITFNTLLKWYYNVDRFDVAEKIWEKMGEYNCVPDIISYNEKLRGLVVKGDTLEAVELVCELKIKGPKPNSSSFNTLIKGFCNDDNLDKAMRIYNQLLDEDCLPTRNTFEMLIPCVYGKGDIDLALKLCKESISRQCFVDSGILQVVVDGLVKESRIEEATKLVELGLSNRYPRAKLKLPSVVN